MHTFFVKLTLFLITIIGILPTSVRAQELPKVAVVSLDTPRNLELEDEVFKTLSDSNVRIIEREEIEKRLDESQSPFPSENVANEFVKMSTTISKGVERYFYENEKKAIKILKPIFDRGMTNLNVLARRPDYADQIFQSGLILIRSYDTRRKKENLKAVVGLIVRNFPTQPFSATVIPPSVIKKLEEARKALGPETTLRLVNRQEKASHCSAFINGFKADLNKKIIVKGNTMFHLRLDCGMENPIVWKIYVKEGEQIDVPLTSKNPLRIGFTSDARTGSGRNRAARKDAEIALSAILFWAKIDHIVGVAEHFKKANEDAKFLVLRIQRGKSPRWSDGAKREDLYKALENVFPELSLKAPEKNEEKNAFQTQETNWWGWSFLGAGTLTLGVATFMLIDGLQGKNTYDNLSHDNQLKPGGIEFATKVDQTLLISYVLYGVGAALAGYGTYHLISHSADSEKENTFHFTPTLSPQRVGFQLTTSF